MTEGNVPHEHGLEIDARLAEFEERCAAAMRRVFDSAKACNEVYFALSLMPEFRGMQDRRWNTAEEAKVAFQ